MYKFIDKNKGSISIFLVIILVPMMTISSLFVDAGRVKLAKSLAASSGDLALNTALTNYDTKLKDLYGLFATAQDTEDLYSKLEDYYRTAITSAGVSDEFADTMTGKIMNSLKSGKNPSETADLLNIQLTDFNVNKLSDGDLANASVLKKQIVEFMKYRCPINTGMSFMSSLKSFSTLSEQTELADDRKKYYEDQGDVMKHFEDAWEGLDEYNNTKVCTDKDFCKNIANSSKTYKERYEKFNNETIMHLYDTAMYYVFKAANYYFDLPTLNNGEQQFLQDHSDNYTENVPALKDADTDKQKGKIFIHYDNYNDNKKSSRKNLERAVKKFDECYSKAEENRKLIKEFRTDYDGLQYIVQHNRTDIYSNWIQSVIDLNTAYNVLRHTYDFCDDRAAAGLTEEKYKEYCDKFQRYSKYFNDDITIVNGYFTDAEKKTPVDVPGEINEYGGQIAAISYEINAFLEEAEKAKKGLETAKKELGHAKKAMQKADETKAKWKEDASNNEIVNSPMAQQDLYEINNSSERFSMKELNKLIDRLDKMIPVIDKMINQVRSYRFHNISLSDIKSFDDFQNVLKDNIGDDKLKSLPLDEGKLESFAKQCWNGSFSVDNIADLNTIGNESGLDLEKDAPNLYKYLKANFDKDESETSGMSKKEAKEQHKQIKETASSDAKESVDDNKAGNPPKGESKKITDFGKDIPSNGRSGKDADDIDTAKLTGENATGEASKSLGGMFKNFKGKLTGMLDKVFISDYIMSMFSYDTIEKEAEQNEKDKKPKTLTKESISTENNYMYGGEAEYIVYGGNDRSANVAMAYGSIYAIRLGFNTIYAFTDSEIRETAFTMATPISAATMGVAPVPLVQSAIIIGVACCESGVDLAFLKDGQKVPLFKDNRTWYTKPSGLVNAAKQGAGTITKELGNIAIDHAANDLTELLDMTDDEITEGAEEIGNKVGNAVDALIERHATVAIQVFTSAIQNAIEDQKTNPDIDVKKNISDSLDKWLESRKANGSALEYAIDKEAVRIIKEQNFDEYIKVINEGLYDRLNELIGQLRDVIQISSVTIESVTKAKDEVISNAKDAVGKGADELRDVLNNQVDTMFGKPNSQSIENTGTTSLIAFSYKDYLRLFTLTGLMSNEESILLRTGDVIQVNMIHQSKNTDYRLSKAVTYVKADATMQVKPLLLALPLFSGLSKNAIDNTNWYTIKYEDIKGY